MSTDRKDSKALAPVASDDYAKTYMPGAGRVLLRDRAVGRGLVVLLGLVTLWCGGGAVAAFLGALPKSSPGVAALVALLAVFFALLTATLTVVRTVVSEGEVQVQYGLWGPRVPVSRIRRCRVTAYDWTKFGGWGIKRSGDGTWAYVLKSGGDVVELSWTDDQGAEKTALFSAADPGAVVAAVDRARALSTRARVATDGREAEPEREAEQERDEDLASPRGERLRR